MSSPSFAELQDRAEQHGRHLANMALTLVGLIALLASLAVGSITKIESPRATAFDVATIFTPLTAAFLFSLLGAINWGLPSPNPQADSAQSVDEENRLALLCLRGIARRNSTCKMKLAGACIMIFVSLAMTFWWLLEHDPTRGLKFRDGPEPAIGSNMVEPKSFLAVKLHSDEVEECEGTSVIIPEQLVRLDFELCPFEPADSRRVAGNAVIVVGFLSPLALVLPPFRAKRHPNIKAALDEDLLVDLEPRARRRLRA